MRGPSKDVLERVYGEDVAEASQRFEEVARGFEGSFGAAGVEYFSSPGRVEIIGNHTDHNGGRILAASVTMDTICAAAPSGDDTVRIVSEGYRDPIVVSVSELSEKPAGTGSTALVAGMLVAAKAQGFAVGGFDAYVSTRVVSSAGISSSASFEMLVGEVVNHLFNGDRMTVADRARMGQYAENHFWNKASGLMDQMACATGGTVLLDFSQGVSCEKVDFSFDDLGYDLVLVNTGKGHADLSEEYSSVPLEMRSVARVLGVDVLAESSEDALLGILPEARAELGCDRALLRALHFYEECGRVDRAVSAIGKGDKQALLSIITESGNSSWKWLQNAFVAGSAAEEPIPLALAMSEIFLSRIGAGACRLHGGGFAGVIMCVLPKDETAAYVDFMSPVFGRENVYRMGTRQTGVVCLGA